MCGVAASVACHLQPFPSSFFSSPSNSLFCNPVFCCFLFLDAHSTRRARYPGHPCHDLLLRPFSVLRLTLLHLTRCPRGPRPERPSLLIASPSSAHSFITTYAQLYDIDINSDIDRTKQRRLTPCPGRYHRGSLPSDLVLTPFALNRIKISSNLVRSRLALARITSHHAHPSSGLSLSQSSIVNAQAGLAGALVFPPWDSRRLLGLSRSVVGRPSHLISSHLTPLILDRNPRPRSARGTHSSRHGLRDRLRPALTRYSYSRTHSHRRRDVRGPCRCHRHLQRRLLVRLPVLIALLLLHHHRLVGVPDSSNYTSMEHHPHHRRRWRLSMSDRVPTPANCRSGWCPTAHHASARTDPR